MTDPKPSTRRATKPKSPTAHKLLLLSEPNIEHIEAQLDALAATGWTVHILSITYTALSTVTVSGWATR
jgi:hypothetical protein